MLELLDYRRRGGRREVLVRWAPPWQHSQHDSWECVSRIEDPELVEELLPPGAKPDNAERQYLTAMLDAMDARERVSQDMLIGARILCTLCPPAQALCID